MGWNVGRLAGAENSAGNSGSGDVGLIEDFRPQVAHWRMMFIRSGKSIIPPNIQL